MCLSWELIYATSAAHSSSVHSNKNPACDVLEIWQLILCEHFDFTFWVRLSIILLWRTIGFEMIRFKANVLICWEGGGKKREVCLLLRVHLISSTLRSSLQAWLNQINFRNHCRTPYRTCKTHFPTNFVCVINHVEIKVKGEGLTLSSES